jgi:hypothetical protein
MFESKLFTLLSLITVICFSAALFYQITESFIK